MIVYIAGSISGRDYKEAREHFSRVQKNFMEKGIQHINPMKLDHDHDKSWEAYMKECIKALMSCDAIYMLKGWEESRGALIEFKLAVSLDYKILFEPL